MYMDGYTITRQVRSDNTDQVEHILIAGNLRNSGVTPAINAKYYINDRLGTPPTKTDYPSDYGVSEGFYPPQATETTKAAALTLDTVRQVQSQKQELFVYGWIKYRDVFNGTKPHITKFCDQLVFDQTPILPASMGQVQWVP